MISYLTLMYRYRVKYCLDEEGEGRLWGVVISNIQVLESDPHV